MIDKSKLQEGSTTLNVDFGIHKISIKQKSDKKWLIMISCKEFVWEFDNWEEMMAQLVTALIDPQKFFDDNKLAMGNRKLKDVDLHVITKHIELSLIHI